MRRYERQERIATEEVLTTVICDRCGKEMSIGEGDEEGASFVLNFGYGSRFDLDCWKIDACDVCSEWLKGEFKTLEVRHGF